MSTQLELLNSDSNAQLNKLTNIIPQIQIKEIRPFVLLALKELEGNTDSRTASIASVDKFIAIRGIVRHLARLRSASNSGWNVADVKAFLDSLKFTAECSQELSQLLCVDDVYSSVPQHLTTKPGLVNVQWKIDLSLCQSMQEREPGTPDEVRNRQLLIRGLSVLLIMNLTDGDTKLYRLSLAKFNELRFTIANILKNYILIEHKKCMKAA